MAATRREVLRIFGEDRLVAVIRTETAALALRAARVLAGAGVRLLEITLTVPDAFEIIEALARDEALAARGAVIGAGTVLSPGEAAEALGCGARFLVSPIFFPELVAAAHAADALAMPGTLTPTEMAAAAGAGADLIKVFPVEPVGGPEYIGALRRVIALPLVATGNLPLGELPAYLAAGVAGFGIGSPLVRADLLARSEDALAAAGAAAFLEATRPRNPHNVGQRQGDG